MPTNRSIRIQKLKLDRNFTPLPPDEGDEFFLNGIFEFNVTKLLAFIGANPNKFPIAQVKVDPLVSYAPERLNEETVLAANVMCPIVLAEISPGRFNVIDGNHRIERARRDGLQNIAAYHVTADRHLAFLTSVKSYETYVKYWNSKVDEAR